MKKIKMDEVLNGASTSSKVETHANLVARTSKNSNKDSYGNFDENLKRFWEVENICIVTTKKSWNSAKCWPTNFLCTSYNTFYPFVNKKLVST